MSRDSSFSPARKPYHDSLEIIVEGEGPGYARLDLNLTIMVFYCPPIMLCLEFLKFT